MDFQNNLCSSYTKSSFQAIKTIVTVISNLTSVLEEAKEHLSFGKNLLASICEDNYRKINSFYSNLVEHNRAQNPLQLIITFLIVFILNSHLSSPCENSTFFSG